MKKLLTLFAFVVLCLGLSVPALAAETACAVEGGSIYFDPDTGAITDCDESVTAANIPASIDGAAVTRIGEYAFFGCSSLTSVTIPDSVTSIGESAFNRCTRLTSVTIPDSVTSIGESAFNHCTRLTSVTIPGSVTSIGESAFNHCTRLTSVTIPNSVTSIGKLAFYQCYSLTSVTIPNSVTSIGNSAFSACNRLTSVTIPSSVTSIGWDAFSWCTSLTSIAIPNSVTSIGVNAFSYCDSLTSVTIPSSVTSIGVRAFYECSRLTDVYYGGSEAQWNAIDISYANEDILDATIHYNSPISSPAPIQTIAYARTEMVDIGGQRVEPHACGLKDESGNYNQLRQAARPEQAPWFQRGLDCGARYLHRA